MAESSTGRRYVPDASLDAIEGTIRRSLLAKLLVAEAGLIATVVVLLWIGGDFTSTSPSAFGFIAGILAMFAVMFGLLIVAGVAVAAAIRLYQRLGGGGGVDGM